MIKDLGGQVVTDIEEGIDVMVTDKLIRNAKLLYSITIGTKIVSMKWLNDSKKKGEFLDQEKYLIVEKEFEKKYGCNLKALY